MRQRMKLAFLPVALALLLLPSPSLPAQDRAPGEAQNSISVDVLMPSLRLLFPTSTLTAYFSTSVAVPIQIDYQRVLIRHWVLSIDPTFTYTSFIGLWKLSPWLALDWHPLDPGLGGVFLGSAISADFKLNAINNDFYAGLGAEIGYQLLLPLNFDLDVAFGMTFGPDFYTEMTYFRSAMRLEIALGYRF